MATIDGGGYYPTPERTRKVVADEDDDYPPYAQPRLYNDEKSIMDPTIIYHREDAIVFIIAGVIGGITLGVLLVVYGFF